jgi:hypothetical protein
MKLQIALQIEMPDEFGTPDSMADMTTSELLEKVRMEVEQQVWLNSDAEPHLVRVNLLINGEVHEATPTVSQVQVQVQVNENANGILPHGTSVRVTFRGEETNAEVIGYDHKYLLHKVRTSCGKVILRKVNQSAMA